MKIIENQIIVDNKIYESDSLLSFHFLTKIYYCKFFINSHHCKNQANPNIGNNLLDAIFQKCKKYRRHTNVLLKSKYEHGCSILNLSFENVLSKSKIYSSFLKSSIVIYFAWLSNKKKRSKLKKATDRMLYYFLNWPNRRSFLVLVSKLSVNDERKRKEAVC